jgi:hypothetical protein
VLTPIHGLNVEAVRRVLIDTSTPLHQTSPGLDAGQK